MLDNIEYKTISKNDFAKEVEQFRSIINGKGRTIAKLAKVDYSVYRNVMQGRISNPAILGSVLRAIKLTVRDIIAQYA